LNKNTFYESMNNMFRDKFRNIHTIKPCVVTRNNGFTVNVRPLTTTKYRDGQQLPIPEIPDVPLMIYSGTKGGARVTVPVVEGDTVVVLCSDRDVGNLFNSTVNTGSIFPSDEYTPLELYPIMAIPMFFTEPEGTPVDTKNIVVENGSTKITVKPSGDIDIDTPANINVNAGGNATVGVSGDASVDVGGNASMTVGGSATIAVTASVQLSGASVTVDSPQTTFTGNVSIAGLAAVTGALTAATIDSDNVSLDNHTHPYTWTDQQVLVTHPRQTKETQWLMILH